MGQDLQLDHFAVQISSILQRADDKLGRSDWSSNNMSKKRILWRIPARTHPAVEESAGFELESKFAWNSGELKEKRHAERCGLGWVTCPKSAYL